MPVTPNSIVTPQTPFSRTAVLTAAETAFNNPVNVVTLLDEADNTNGARITRLFAIPRASVSSANNIQIYVYDGATHTLLDSALMSTVSPNASVANTKTDFGYSEDSPLYVRSGCGLKAAMGQAIANGVVVSCQGGLY